MHSASSIFTEGKLNRVLWAGQFSLVIVSQGISAAGKRLSHCQCLPIPPICPLAGDLASLMSDWPVFKYNVFSHLLTG